MKRRFLSFVVVISALLHAGSALAVGGGGGGSVPSCTDDVWDCTGWSQCSGAGTQTRVCTMTYDCPTANTPSPAESQQCIPTAGGIVTAISLAQPKGGETLTAGSVYQIFWTWSGTAVVGVRASLSTDGGLTYPTIIVADAQPTLGEQDWTVPDISTSTARIKVEALGSGEVAVASDADKTDFSIVSAATPSPAPAPAPAPQPAPASPPPSAPPQEASSAQSTAAACTVDVWSCGPWSASCDANGREHRSCNLASDCPGVETPPPFETRPCSHLQCGDKPAMRDRISCRLNLTPAGAARDLELQYLPEACRVKTGAARQECIDLYKSFKPCWALPDGEKRFACARTALGIGPSVASDLRACRKKTGDARTACLDARKEKALYMILFRFYDLETRSEDLGNQGLDLGIVTDFETTIETVKQDFDAAATYAKRRADIFAVRRAWRDLGRSARKAKAKFSSDDKLSAAFADLWSAR